MAALTLHPDRFFPSDPATRGVARELFAKVEKLPILSPHGHTDPKWWRYGSKRTTKRAKAT